MTENPILQKLMLYYLLSVLYFVKVAETALDSNVKLEDEEQEQEEDQEQEEQQEEK